MNTLNAITIVPDASEVLHAFGEQVTIHLGGKETGGKFCIFTEITPPGSGPPPHYHRDQDEWFYPLAGRVEFFLDGEWNEVAVGSVVFVPKGMVHTFRNSGDEPLKMLVHIAPSGFEKFFRQCADEFANAGELDMDRIFEISAEYGIQFIME